MGTGIVKGLKKAGRAVKGAGKAVGKAVDVAEIKARAIDKTVDRLKDDQFVVEGESVLEIFGVNVGRIYHHIRMHVADKE